ncbi:MAG: hypothetical protein CVV56_08415 [Tenericutes bacterium HGW-Tenericutes-1]|jgi:uncharacterized protein (DUF983 family)|nr:MAG: hypothetical protein CVV58_00090 [Tenericutes bacterium HGW-Tenericutes-3]PKK99965.1 MAG: hypothetical protein CVV56_08415 [Tenericutes bacterium HGW-Tenericutes-1]
MKFKCPHCGKETISFKQKFLSGYVNRKYAYCKECGSNFKFSIISDVLAVIFALVYDVCIIYILYKLNNETLWNMLPLFQIPLLLTIPFIVHFGKLVKGHKLLTIEPDPTNIREKLINIDKDIDNYKIKQ